MGDNPARVLRRPLGDAPVSVGQADAGVSLFGTPLPEFTAPLRSSVGETPERRPGSVRRTLSIDVHWPAGDDTSCELIGRGRDISSDAPDRAPAVLAEAGLRALLTHREVATLSLTPAIPGMAEITNVNAGGALRKAFAMRAPDERARGSITHMLIDDVGGTSLVAVWTPRFWRRRLDPASTQGDQNPIMAGMCIGFRAGGGALAANGRRKDAAPPCPAEALGHPLDPLGWHVLPGDLAKMNFRRARRTDIWRENGGLAVDAHFQDSASDPDGGARLCIHEYRVSAWVDAQGTLRDLDIAIGTLPFPSCLAAPVNVAVLIDQPVATMREAVPLYLKGTAGCTHLNDVMRSLADVPALAAHLP